MDLKEIGKEFPDSRDYEAPAIMSDGLVLFPGNELLTAVSDQTSLAAIREALKKHQVLAYIPLSSREKSGPIGTLALVKDSGVVEGGPGLNVELKGMWRIRVKRFIDSPDYTKVQFEKADEYATANSTDASSLVQKVQGEIDEFVKLIPAIPSEIVSLLKHAETPGVLADMCASSPEFTHDEKVELLGMLDQVERLRKVSNLLERQLVSIRQIVQVEPISQCERCMELADRVFESDPSKRPEIAITFLNHVVREHTAEVISVLAEKYGPVFSNRRSLR
jgi:ATP-dependent Lon protease